MLFTKHVLNLVKLNCMSCNDISSGIHVVMLDAYENSRYKKNLNSIVSALYCGLFKEMKYKIFLT